jgi:tetraacyldisaccharide 4'-kinase
MANQIQESPRPQPASPMPAALRWSGPLLACGYGIGVKLHRAFSQPRWPPLPAICIGNLTAGGTGKTPASIYFSRKLAQSGRKPAVLMRGYKDQARDEALEIDAALADLNLPSKAIANPDRYAGALAAKAAGCDVVLLDDGFQHWRLARDLDIVLIDATDPFSGGRLLPHGRLRENPSGLARAGVVIVTRADAVPLENLAQVRAEVQRLAPQALIVSAQHSPQRLRPFGKKQTEPSSRGQLAGLPILAACGIGNPEAFRRTLIQQGARVLDFVAFSDHHRYSEGEISSLFERARSLKAGGIVVTAKDRAKLELLRLPDEPAIWSLDVVFEIRENEAELWQRIEQAVVSGVERLKRQG